MFVFGNVFIYLLFLFLCDQTLTSLPDELMLELYSKYISAVSKANFTISTRRLFKKYREFEIHVTKLKEVNGYKKHNLFVKENVKYGGREPYIYINNPVESKIPRAYLTLDEFKNALTNRVQTQKNEFSSKRTKKDTYKNIFRLSTYETRQTILRKKDEIINITGKFNLKANTDTIKYNEAVKERNSLNKDKTTSTETVLEYNNDVHENVTISEKDLKNNITLYLVTDVTEDIKHERIKEDLKNFNEPDIDATEAVTENTNIEEVEETTSPSRTINVENEIVTDTTAVVENKLQFRTNKSQIVSNIENMTKKSPIIKEVPRRKKTTKYSSISMDMRRSTLGRPLVFFGSR